MKRTFYIFLIIFIIGAIFYGFKEFYKLTGYYVWSNEAKTSEVLRIEGSFALHDNYKNVTANGEIINCSNSDLEIKSNDILLYCRDKRDDSVYVFKNVIAYTLTPEKKVKIEILIYDGTNIIIGENQVKQICNNYFIEKIEYQKISGEIFALKTISETGSYFMPLGFCLTVPFLITLIALVSTFIIQWKNQSKFNFKDIIKNISVSQKIFILIILLTIPITFIIIGGIAFNDNHYSVAAYSVIVTISSLIIIGLITLISLICIRLKRKKKLLVWLTNRAIELNKELQIIKKPFDTNISELSSKIRSNQNKIKRYKRDIKKYNSNIVLSEISYVDNLTGLDFEEYCVKLFSALGYSALKTKSSGDFGADLILNKSISVQCKLYNGVVGFQEVYSSMARYKTKDAWVITNSTFTKQAKEYAKDANVRLIDRDELKALIKDAFINDPSTYISDTDKKIKQLNIENCKLRKQIDKLSGELYAKTQEFQAKTQEIQQEVNELDSLINKFDSLNNSQIKALSKEYLQQNN